MLPSISMQIILPNIARFSTGRIMEMNVMNEKRRPQGNNPPRRADRFADRTPVEEVEGQLEGRNALTEALRSGRTID